MDATAPPATPFALRDLRLPLGVAVVAAGLYLLVSPPSADLAAQTYRVDLFERAGFTIWNNGWYGGHHTPAYSLLFPPLGAALGIRLAGALAAVAAAVLFAKLALEHFGPRARPGALWFAAGTGAMLCSGRMTYVLGVAIALGALAALQADRRRLAAVLAALSGLGSPVAALFLALALVAWGVVRPKCSPPEVPPDPATASPRLTPPTASPVPPARASPACGASHDDPATGYRTELAAGSTERRPTAAVLTAAAIVPVLVLAGLFGEGGDHQFVASAFWPGLAGAVLVGALLPRTERELRAGAAVYAIGCIATFAVTSPLGGNVSRLGELAAGPVLACALAGRARPRVLVAALAPLAFWQVSAPVREVARATGDPSVHARYYDGVVDFLEQQAAPGSFRVEVPFTRNHWEAFHVARAVPIARGWARQLDRLGGELFYDGNFTAARYRAWLDEHAVRFVALADTELDRAGKDEAAFVRSRPSWLRPVYRDAHWQVFAVSAAKPLMDGVLGAARLTETGFVLRARAAGTARVRVRPSRWWTVVSGAACVEEGPEETTEVDVKRPGTIVVRARLTGPDCRGKDTR